MRGWLGRGMLAVLVGATLVATPAHATEGLAWQWTEDTERRWFLEAQVRLAELMLFQEQANTDIRIAEFYVGAITSCRLEHEAKRTWDLVCSLDDVQLRAAPVASDKGRIGDLLDEWEALLREATVQLTLGKDGRIRTFDLDGVPNRIRRLREIEETMRQVLRRAYAGLEIELPKGGDDGGQPWVQKGSLITDLPVTTGSFGGVTLTHSVTVARGGRAVIETAGGGTFSTGEDMGGPEDMRQRNYFDTELSGSTTFDLGEGYVVKREYVSSAKPTASSALATGVAGTTYVQGVRIDHLDEGEDVPVLGENGEMELSGN